MMYRYDIVIKMTAFATHMLKEIRLIYNDGTILSLPEQRMPTVGPAFMKLIKDEQLEWNIVSTGKQSWRDKLKKFFDF